MVKPRSPSGRALSSSPEMECVCARRGNEGDVLVLAVSCSEYVFWEKLATLKRPLRSLVSRRLWVSLFSR